MAPQKPGSDAAKVRYFSAFAAWGAGRAIFEQWRAAQCVALPTLLRTIAVPSPYLRRFILGFQHEIRGCTRVGVEMYRPRYSGAPRLNPYLALVSSPLVLFGGIPGWGAVRLKPLQNSHKRCGVPLRSLIETLMIFFNARKEMKPSKNVAYARLLLRSQ